MSSAAISSSICIASSAPAWPTAIRRRPRCCSSSASPARPRLAHLWNADWQWNVFAPAGPVRRSVAVGEARAQLHRRAARRAAHRAADSRAAGSARDRQRHQPAADAAAARVAARDRLRRRAAAGRPKRAPTCRPCCAMPSSSISSPARTPTMHWKRQLDTTLTDHRRQRRSASILESQTAFTTPGLAALGEFRSSLAHLKDLDSEALVAADARHARPLGASARRVGHVVRDQAAGGDARRRADGPVRRRLRLGGESQADPRVAREAGDRAAAGEPGRCRRRRTTAASFTRRR